MVNVRRLLILLSILTYLGIWLLLIRLEGQYSDDRENYSLIERGLYMGGDVAKPPRGTRAVINLCEQEDSYQAESHLWEPIRDAPPAPSMDWLRRMVEWIDRERGRGITVYVHCRNGVSRSGLLITAYFMHKNHWTRDEALAFVRSKRPQLRPIPAFLERLVEWENVLRQRG